MTNQDVIGLFRETGALLEGHFVYASGRHGNQFLQAARVVQYPPNAEVLCKTLAARFADSGVELVCGPATGGIILAHETARHLGCRAAYTEKEPDGSMALKRGFRLNPGTNVLVVEDIATTGGSVKKTIDHIVQRGSSVAGVGVLIDRSGGSVRFDCRYEALAHLAMQSWLPEECPLCRQGVPLIEPDDIQI